MQTMKQQRFLLGGVALAAVLLAGCATSTPPAASASAPAASTHATAAAPVQYFAVLPEDGRYYLFGDAQLYLSYLQLGEVALTHTRIGASPTQTTVVFGMTNADAKSDKPLAAEILFDGKATTTSPFYGEAFKDGRYYVFNDLKDMNIFLEHGEAALAFTDIGAGPNGASLVWVMNNQSMQKGRPLETMAMFKAIRAAK